MEGRRFGRGAWRVLCAAATVAASGALGVIVEQSPAHIARAAAVASPAPWKYSATVDPGGTGITSISCPDMTNCIGLTVLGGVVASGDGGRTWTLRSTPSQLFMFSQISCATQLDCVLLDSWGPGPTYSSTDGGVTWTESTNTSISWSSIPQPTDCLPSVCIGVAGSQVETSTNLGYTWTTHDTSASGLFTASCASASFCVAAGHGVFVSTDEGATWLSRSVPTGIGVLMNISCPAVPVCHAIAFTSNRPYTSVFLTTTDAGVTWQQTPMPQHLQFLTTFSCTSYLHCITTGNETVNGLSPVYVTTDAGATWAQAVLPVPGMVHALACLSAAACVAEGNQWAAYSTDGGWSWRQSVLPAAWTVMPTCFSPSVCMVSEGDGRIFRTTDGGRSWRPSVLPDGASSVTSISCAAAGRCIASASLPCPRGCSDFAMLLRSADDGATWQVAPIPPSVATTGYNALMTACLPSGACIAAANEYLSNVTILRTTDGGSTWSVEGIPGIQNVTMIGCDTSSTCMVASSSAIAVSTDGAATWRLVTPTFSASIQALTCTGVETCIAFAQWWSGGTSYEEDFVTTNAGTTWTTHPLPTGVQLEDVTCATAMDCAAVAYPASASGDPLYFSTDGGANWAPASVPPGQAAGVYGVSCVAPSTCLAGGLDLLSSTNAGATWTVAAQPPPTGALVQVSCADQNACVAVGSQAAMATTDGGATWTTEPFPAGVSGIDAVSCASGRDCVGVGPGVALRTTDGGATWSAAPVPAAPGNLFGVSCPTGSTCIAVGEMVNGGTANIVVSGDGGATWTTEPVPAGTGSLIAISCATAQTCDAIGVQPSGAPSLIASGDSGQTWHDIPLPPGTTELYGISCSASTCVAVGHDPQGRSKSSSIVYSNDAGATWSETSVPPAPTCLTCAPAPVPFTSVSCAGTRCSASTRTNGAAIYVSNDGGATWNATTDPNAPSGSTSMSCATVSTCVALGSLGGVFQTLEVEAPMQPGPAEVSAAAGNGDATVSWTPSPPQQDTPVTTGYVVTPYSGSTALTPLYIDRATTTTAVVGDLTNGTTYTFQVQVVNAAGPGPQTTSNAVTPSSTPSASVTAVTPPSGPESGNTPVVIDGAGFTGVTRVSFGSAPAASYTVVSGTEITATSPAVASAGPVAVSVTGAGGTGGPTSGSTFTYRAGSPYHPVAPVRICDTRTGSGIATNQCDATGPATLGPGTARTVNVTTAARIPAKATAVVLNVTATDTTANGGYLTLWPAGGARPTTSNVNWPAGATVAAQVTVGLGSGGSVEVANGPGSADVIVDVEGYVAPDTTATTAGLFNPAGPARLADTRNTPGNPYQAAGGTLSQGMPLTLDVTGAGGVPATGVSAVILNVTATDTTANGGYLTLWPAGTTKPTASVVNWNEGQTVANRIIAKVGTNGAIELASGIGSADVVVDVSGWFTDGSVASATGGAFTPVAPRRIVDTRSYTGNIHPFASDTLGPPIGPAVTGLAGVPARGATAVVVNVTATDTSAANGYLTVWPGGTPQSATSDVNWTTAGATVANAVTVQPGADGDIDIANATGSADVVVDVFGWYS